jgi:hypothetical protein
MREWPLFCTGFKVSQNEKEDFDFIMYMQWGRIRFGPVVGRE